MLKVFLSGARRLPDSSWRRCAAECIHSWRMREEKHLYPGGAGPHFGCRSGWPRAEASHRSEITIRPPLHHISNHHHGSSSAFWAEYYLALCINGCVFLQQKFGHLHVAVLGRQVERSEAPLRRCSVRCSVLQQNRRHLPRSTSFQYVKTEITRLDLLTVTRSRSYEST